MNKQDTIATESIPDHEVISRVLGGEKAVSGHSDRRRARGISSRGKDDGNADRADDPRSESAH